MSNAGIRIARKSDREIILTPKYGAESFDIIETRPDQIKGRFGHIDVLYYNGTSSSGLVSEYDDAKHPKGE